MYVCECCLKLLYSQFHFRFNGPFKGFFKDLVYAVAYHLGSAELLCLSDHCQSGPDLEQPDHVKENVACQAWPTNTLLDSLDLKTRPTSPLYERLLLSGYRNLKTPPTLNYLFL